MKKTKGISAYEVQKLIIELEANLKSIEERSEVNDTYAHSVALGMAETVISTTIKKLKGEYAI